MHELIQTIKSYLRLAWLYRWVGLVLAITTAIAGWFYVYSMPDQYKVSAKLYLDSSSMLRPLLKGLAVKTNALQDSALMLERTLLTRPNLEAIAREADLDLEAETPEQFDSIVQRLGSKIKITKTKREHIYDIVYFNQQPERAKKIIDEILNTFLESSLGSTRKDNAATQRFLDEQIAEYETRLIAAEERLKEFKQRNIGVMPGSQGGYFNRLQTAHSDLKAAQLELQEAQNRLEQLKANAAIPQELTGGDTGAGAGWTSPELAKIDNRITDYNTRIDNLLLVYTEKYPDIVVFRKRIEDLEVQREDEIARLKERALVSPQGAISDDSTVEPYRQEIKLQISDAASIVAGLQTRVKEYENRVADLERRVDVVPEVEAELARLNRDYSINKSQYGELLQRREQAYLSQEADQTQDDVKIRILEPPRLPIAPAGPNRVLFLSFVLLAAIGLGAGLSVLMSQLNRRVLDTTDLKEITGLNVLGSVGMKQNRQHRRRRRTEVAAFATGVFGLVSAYFVQVFLYQQGIAVHEKLALLVGTVI